MTLFAIQNFQTGTKFHPVSQLVAHEAPVWKAKLPERECDHSTQAGAEVESVSSCTSIPVYNFISSYLFNKKNLTLKIIPIKLLISILTITTYSVINIVQKCNFIKVCELACMQACGCMSVCMSVRACSLAYLPCNAYAPYCDVICGPSGSTIFFDIIS
jgi:hypothetical protein